MCLALCVATPVAADPLRGEYLARAGDCMSCHTAPDHPAFSGGRGLKTPFGEIYATNITPDRDTGIGQYRLKDFDRAVRRGVARDGHHLYPGMPYPSFSRISDEDIADLYDYLMHSVAPIRQQNRKTHLPFPFNLRWGLIFWNWLFKPHSDFKVQEDQDVQWNRGAYLVETLGHCGSCHTPRGLFFEERGMTAKTSSFLTGGTLEYWHAPTLHGNTRNGPGDWSEAELAGFLKMGHSRRTIAFGSMAEVVEVSTQYLTDADRAAIARYVVTLPPRQAAYVAPPYRTAATQEWPGAGRYAQLCASCHGPAGEGKAGIPALAGNSALQAEDGVSVIHMILKGARGPQTLTGPKPAAMPGFEPDLTDREIAELATFVRQSWGNRAPAVTEAGVRRARQVLIKEPVRDRMPMSGDSILARTSGGK